MTHSQGSFLTESWPGPWASRRQAEPRTHHSLSSFSASIPCSCYAPSEAQLCLPPAQRPFRSHGATVDEPLQASSSSSTSGLYLGHLGYNEYDKSGYKVTGKSPSWGIRPSKLQPTAWGGEGGDRELPNMPKSECAPQLPSPEGPALEEKHPGSPASPAQGISDMSWAGSFRGSGQGFRWPTRVTRSSAHMD